MLMTCSFPTRRASGRAGKRGSRGKRFADAPVMRTRAAAEAGTLAVPVGADGSVFDQIADLLRMFASDVMHVGDVGAGQVVKILNNMVLYETVLALAEARAIGRSEERRGGEEGVSTGRSWGPPYY